MKILKDLGRRFPRLESKSKSRYFLVECNCGQQFEAIKGNLRDDLSCSQCASKKRAKSKTKHGMINTKLYHIWNGIKQRCHNSNSPSYDKYGAMGVCVYKEWYDSFECFAEWAANNGYSDELSLDRIDASGNYEPTNCRWTTNDVQSQNVRGLSKNNTSGYKGVHFAKNKQKWSARISISNKRIFLGLFDTARDGAIAYNKYIQENNLEHTLNEIKE